MSFINTQDLAANIADDFDISPNEAFGLVDELLFDLEEERLGVWASE